MKIPKELPQINNQNALFVVCGKVTAELYYIHQGNLTNIDGFRVNHPSYSDDEGFSMRHTKSGTLYKSGGIRKDTTETYMDEKFLKTLSEKVGNALKKYAVTEIYLFSPGHTTKKVRESWSHPVQKIVRRSIRGNYTNENPLDLMRKKEKKKKSRPVSNSQVSPEARKIYQSFNQSNHMIQE
jgi:hypothetical protein